MPTTNFSTLFRRGRRQVEDIGFQAEEQLEQHFIQRLGRLLNVRRFVIVWLLLLLFLIGGVTAQLLALGNYYQSIQPVPGGIYTEGILGDFTNANPLYAVSPVDSAVSKLLFAGLLTYNNQNQLVGNLASSWSVDPTSKIYTIHLKPNLTWQDGQPLTADDVVFTYSVIQNPDAQSPLNSSWQGVTVVKVNSLTVTFTLPSPLTAFPYSLTNGIVPKHLLGALPMSEMRSTDFNTADPVGAGPFSWQTIQVQGSSPSTRQEEIALVPFAGYNAGRPKLESFVIRAFHDQGQLITSFRQNELDAVAGLDSVPSSFKESQLQIDRLNLTAATMVFFKNSAAVLSDAKVRQALVQAADVDQIINGLGHPVVPVREPLLVSQLGYDPQFVQDAYNQAAAMQTLQADGWSPGKGGVLYKDGQPLSFNLFASNNAESTYIISALQAEWRVIGVDVRLYPQSDSDLQNTIAFHSYDALLYSISIGVDPDVFAYWDSSQANVLSPNRLNLSEYKSSAADESLEGGRTRADPTLRAIKYRPFLQAWQSDAPALGLYQPQFLYMTREPVYGLDAAALNSAADRFNNVQNWEIRTAKVTD